MAGPALLVQRRGPRELPAGVQIADVADLSRAALVAFLRLGERSPHQRGIATDRAELATWLFGPYLNALSVGRPSLGVTEPSLVLEDATPEADVSPVIVNAARRVERVLAAFHADPDLTVATHLLDRGVVEPVIDERGGTGYAPLASSGMPLSVRVLALVAAELLTRPARLRADLVVSARGIEIAERPVASGVGIRSRQTLPWIPSRDERTRSPGWPARAPTLAELVAAAQDGFGSDDD